MTAEAPARTLDPLLPVSPHVATLPPYNAGMSLAQARSLSGRDDIARLASNESPDGCSPAVLVPDALAITVAPSLACTRSSLWRRVRASRSCR